jgi:hypothetical protein
MNCPNKLDPHYQAQVEYLGEVRSFYLFNANNGVTPDLRETGAFNTLVGTYGEGDAMLAAYNEFVAGKKVKNKVVSDPADFLKYNFKGSGYISPKSIDGAFITLANQLGLTIKDTAGTDKYLAYPNGKVFNPKLFTASATKNSTAAAKAVVKAEKAWIKEKLGKDFPVDIAHRIIKGKAWGRFSKAGIELYEAAPAGVGYHEAFHAVFNLALGHGEREVILAEARGRKGNENKSEAQLEEILADEFSDYIISGGKIKLPEVQAGFFARILNALKQMFQTNISIEDLYKGIDEGRFQNLAMDLATYKSTGAHFKVIEAPYMRKDNLGNPIEPFTLTEQETYDFMEGISIEFFELMFNGGNPERFFSKTSDVEVEAVYDGVRHNLREEAINHLNSLESDEEYDRMYDMYTELLGLDQEFNIDPELTKNWHHAMKHHMSITLPQFGLSTKGVESVDLNQEKEHVDSAFNQVSIETNTKDGIPKSMKAILLGLREKFKQGKDYSIAPFNKNSLGFSKMVPMGTVFAILANKLAGNNGDYDYMYTALSNLEKTSPDYGNVFADLKERLGGDKQTDSAATHRLRTQFTQSFSKNKYNVDIHLMDSSGKLYLVDANSESLKGHIKKESAETFRTVADKDVNGIHYIPKEDLDVIAENLGDSTKMNGLDWFSHIIGMPMNIAALADYRTEDGKTINERIQFALKSPGIYEDIEVEEGGEIKTIKGLRDPYNNKVSTINQVVNELVNFKASTLSDITDSSHINPEGKRIYGVSLHSAATKVASTMSRYSGDPEGMRGHIPYLYNTYTENSFIKQLVEEGDIVEIGVSEGVAPDSAGEKGLVTKRLSPTDRQLQHMTSVLNGKYPFIRTADRSVENTLSVGGGKLLVSDIDQGTELFARYLADELNAIDAAKKGAGREIKHYNQKAKEFRFFGPIVESLPSNVKDLIIDNPRAAELIMEDGPVRNAVLDSIKTYFKAQAIEESKFAAKLGLEAKDFKDEFAKFGDDMFLMYTMNAVAGNIEQTKLFFGDPAVFKSITDTFKRTTLFNATKKVSRIGDSYNNAAEEFLPKYEVEGANIRPYDDTFKAIIVEDLEVNSPNIANIKNLLKTKFGDKADDIVKAFEGYEEGDAQGYVSLNGYREIMDRAGDWSAEHEAVFQKIVANENAKITAEEMVYFHPLKTQYAGPIKNTEGVANATTVHKHSLFPLIPAVIKDNSLLKDLNNFMMKNDVTFVEFASANKLGTIQEYDSQDDYDNYDENLGKTPKLIDENGLFALSADTPMQSNYFEFFGIQLDILGDPKSKISMGTQMGKELGANAYEFGNIRKDKDDYQKKVKKYHEAKSDFIKYHTNKVKDALGVKAVETEESIEGPTKFKIEDVSKFREYLKKVVDLKEADDNILNGIESFQEGDYIEYLPNYQSLESVLTSIINNKIIKAKVPGGAKVQVASSGWAIDVDSENPLGRKLNFYKDDKGEITGMEVLLPHYFKEIAKDLDISEVDDKLKEIIAFRIPTQAPSSLELVKIAGFLPKYGGDMIVVPSEHVAKGGSDFDIDKLNVYLPAYDIVDGKPVYITQGYERGNKDFTEKKLHNKLLETQIALMKDKEFMSEVATPIDSTNLASWKGEIEKLRETNDLYKDDLKKEETMSDVFLPRTSIEKFRDFLAGQAGVGQTALHVPHHSLGQLVNLHINPILKTNKSNGHFYAHHSDDKQNVLLGGVMDKKGEYYIKDMLSEFLNAYVDIAKDPYIFALNAGTQVANTIFYMLRTGANPKWVMHFVTQPAIVEYIKQRGIQESLAFQKSGGKVSEDKDTTVANVLSMFGTTATGMLYNGENGELMESTINDYESRKPSLKSLQDEIAGNNSPAMQKMVLDQFLLYTEYSKHLQKAIKASGVDTKGMGKNLNEAEGILAVNEEVLRDGVVMNQDKLFKETYLGSMQEAIRDFSQSFNEISLSKAERFRKPLASFKHSLLKYQKGDRKEALSKAVDNDLAAYLMQTGLAFEENGVTKSVLDNIKGSHKQLSRYLKKNPALANNAFINSLVLNTNRGSKMEDIFSIFNKKRNAAEKNVLIADFDKLFDMFIDVKEIGLESAQYNLGELMALIGFEQSGISKSPSSYTEIVPNEKFKYLVTTLIARGQEALYNTSETNMFDGFFEQFIRNRPYFLPKVPKGSKFKVNTTDNSVKVQEGSWLFDSPGLVKYVKDPNTKVDKPIIYSRVAPGVFKAVGYKGQMGNAPDRVDYRYGAEYNTPNVIDISLLNDEEAKKIIEKCK